MKTWLDKSVTSFLSICISGVIRDSNTAREFEEIEDSLAMCKFTFDNIISNFQNKDNADDTTISNTDGDIKDGMDGNQYATSVTGTKQGRGTGNLPGRPGGKGKRTSTGTDESGQEPGRGARAGEGNIDSTDDASDQSAENAGEGVPGYQGKTGRGVKPLPTKPSYCCGTCPHVPLNGKRYVISATQVPVSMHLIDYRERNLKDIITQPEPGLFKKVTGLTVSDFALLVSLGVLNSAHITFNGALTF